MFGEFSRPMTFHPDWKLPARIPPLPSPQDPTQRLLWVVGPDAAMAKPWLPTLAEQDAAWWETFGSGVERAQRNRMNLEGFRGVFAG